MLKRVASPDGQVTKASVGADSKWGAKPVCCNRVILFYYNIFDYNIYYIIIYKVADSGSRVQTLAALATRNSRPGFAGTRLP